MNMINAISNFKKISFGVLSPEEIRKMSCCNVTAVKVSDKGENIYSKYMGTIENGQLCKTCHRDVWECPNHFGHFELQHPIINPIFLNDAANILRCVCFKCYSFLLSEQHLKLANVMKKFPEILTWVKTIKYCYKCNMEKNDLSVVNGVITEVVNDDEKVVIDVYKVLRVLENVSDDTVSFLGFDSEMAHPKNYVLTVFPVLPPCCRPYVISDDNYCDDDLTYQLVEIIKNNHNLSKEFLAITEKKRQKSLLKASLLTTESIHQKHSANLDFRIATYIDNSKKKAKHAATARPITGLKERIAGKDGHIRHNLLGKRCDQSGRTVVGPDPTLRLDELIVPRQMAEILTIPVHVTSFNIRELTALVNSGKANFLIRASKPKQSINLKNAVNFRGTILQFGDIVEHTSLRNGVTQTVIVDTKFSLREGDAIIRGGKRLKKVVYPEKREIELKVGDIVKRQLSDGDYVLLNRQPTLHKASMMAFKAVIKDVKTLKINLASTKPFNCDFDGDEMNIHVPQSYEAMAELQELSSAMKCVMSNQNGKPNMAIVQDSLVGLYYLSKEMWGVRTFEKDQFFDLLMTLELETLDVLGRVRDIKRVLRQKIKVNSVADVMCGNGVLSFVFPFDLDFQAGEIKIKDGVFVSGRLDKNVVSKLIKTIYNDYGEKVVGRFIDNVQFVTNKFLLERGFTINAADCLPKFSPTQLLNKTFSKTNMFKDTVINPFIREQKILASLNSCTDQSMKQSKDALTPDNNFLVTEESGSKGSVFNICQITSMMGQQTIDGKRLARLIHPQDNEYCSRGFITRGLTEGLSPREFFSQAMSGRKGVSDTALLTSVSGYGQRQGVKLNEDIKIYPDFTVRDVNGRLYQYIFGEAGYDPSQTVIVDGVQTFCDVHRLVSRLLRSQRKSSMRPLTSEELDSMTNFIQPRHNIPIDVETRICMLRKAPIINQLKNVLVVESIVPTLKKELEIRFYKSLMSPGECVGIIGAQSMGEFNTQATLNTFHVAGSLSTGKVTNSLTRFQEINNASKNPKNVTCKVYFTSSNSSIEEIKNVSSKLKQIYLHDLVLSWVVQPGTLAEGESKPAEGRCSGPKAAAGVRKHSGTEEWWYAIFRKVYSEHTSHTPPPTYERQRRIRCIIRKSVVFSYKISLEAIKHALEAKHQVRCIFSPMSGRGSGELIFDIFPKQMDENTDGSYIDIFMSNTLACTLISGIEGIKSLSYHKDEKLNVWYVETEGGSLKSLYTLDNIDEEHTSSNNIWDIYNTFGIEAAREFRISEMVEIMESGVDLSHIKLRADRLTFTGTVQSLTRYTMRGEKPFSKIGFEETMENFYRIARDAESDDLNGVSASIICGKRAKVGTSMFDVKVDISKILGRYDEERTGSSIREERTGSSIREERNDDDDDEERTGSSIREERNDDDDDEERDDDDEERDDDDEERDDDYEERDDDYEERDDEKCDDDDEEREEYDREFVEYE
jgi:DNA-directed RNA polymerase beta' subunit